MSRTRNVIRLLSAATLVLSLAAQLLPAGSSAAAQITNRSLTLEAGTSGDGGSKPSGNVKHLFQFTLSDLSDAIGSITFQYCTTAAAVPNGIGCVAPSGLSTQNATLGSENGVTGFTTTVPGSLDDASDGQFNTVTLERTTASPIGGTNPVSVSYELDSVVNPGPAPQTFFVRISTNSATNGSGTEWESGTVAAATSTQVILNGTMPESLVFCAGASVSETAGVPDCSTVTTGVVNFDRLFSPTDTALATSQMAASTNAGQGYAITVNGSTLTSGSNTITALTTTDTSKHGISQFGMNLVLNDGTAYAGAPNLSDMSTAGEPNSANVNPASGTGNYNGLVSTGYDTGGSFTFNDNQAVATSNSKGTDAQIYTSSYIVNVPGSQPAGTYTTTLTYICTPTF